MNECIHAQAWKRHQHIDLRKINQSSDLLSSVIIFDRTAQFAKRRVKGNDGLLEKGYSRLVFSSNILEIDPARRKRDSSNGEEGFKPSSDL